MNKRLRLSIVIATICTFSGLGVNVKTTSIEPLAAVAQSCIRNENFSLVVASTIGIALRSEPRLNARTNETVAYQQTVDFDAWTYGEEITDLWGSRDALWFKLRGRNLWVPSGYIKGFPPSRPSPRPNGTQICQVPPLPTTAAAANFAFKTQYYNPTYNPDGPNSSGNCGPTSLAIILKLLGREKPGLSVQQSINEASRLMGRAPNASFTSWAQLITGIRNAGGKPEELSSRDAIDRSLADGKPVIANGFYGENWRRQFPNYQLTGSGNVAHLNTILGRTADGRYIVADPMYRGGTVEMNWNQLAVYFPNGVAGIAFAR